MKLQSLPHRHYTPPNTTRHGATLLGTAQCPLRQRSKEQNASGNSDKTRRVAVDIWRLAPQDARWVAATANDLRANAPDAASVPRMVYERYLTLTEGLSEAAQAMTAPNKLDSTAITLAATYKRRLVGLLHGEAPAKPGLSGLEAHVRWLSAGYHAPTKPRGVGQVLVSQFYRQCQELPIQHITLSAIPWQVKREPHNPQLCNPTTRQLDMLYWKLGLTPLRRHPEKLTEMSPQFRAQMVEAWHRLGPQALETLFVIPKQKSLRDAAAIEQFFKWQPASPNPTTVTQHPTSVLQKRSKSPPTSPQLSAPHENPPLELEPFTKGSGNHQGHYPPCHLLPPSK